MPAAEGPWFSTPYAARRKSCGPAVITSITRRDRRPLGGEVARHVERPGEIEVEHPRAPVGAERLRRHQRGEERERQRDDVRVLAVRRQDLVVAGLDRQEGGDADEDQRRHERDHERDPRQHLVPEAPVQARGRAGACARQIVTSAQTGALRGPSYAR